MAAKLKNIIEDIAADFLNRTLALRYDICTCPACKNDMLAYVLSRVPAKYVTTEEGALHTLEEQTRIEHQADIGRAVLAAIDIVSKSPRHQKIEDMDSSFKLLLDKIRSARGLDLRHYRQEILKRRLALRIHANGMRSYSEYLHLLIKDPGEYDELFDVLCINVSEFFRDAEVWVTVRYLFENLIRQKKQKNENNLKVWSAGCASGEEPYSIAIFLKEILGQASDFSPQIFATDIDKTCLKNLQRAEYQKEQLKNVDKEYFKKYFTSSQEGKYKLVPEIKAMVESQYLDLTGQENLADLMDVVFCRNVFIYFSRSLQEQILMKFYKSLKPKGFLVMGKVELIINEAKEIFEEIDSNAHIYQKR